MKRHRLALLGLACTLWLAGCKQVPLRDPTAQRTGNQQAAPVGGKLDSQLSLARLSERHGQHDYARQIYEAILGQHPGNAQAHHRLAVLAARQRNFMKAEQHFEQAFALGPRSPELLADLGYYFYIREQLDEAEQTLRESLAADPQQKGARNNLALVLGEQRRYDEAYEQFSKILTDAEAHANMGYVYAMTGDFVEAEREFHEALALDNTLRAPAEALIQLQQEHQKFESLARARAAQQSKTADRAAQVARDDSLPAGRGLSEATSERAEIDGRPTKKLIASTFERPRRPIDERTGLPARTANPPVRQPIFQTGYQTGEEADPPRPEPTGGQASARMQTPRHPNQIRQRPETSRAPALAPGAPKATATSPVGHAADVHDSLSHSEHLTTGPLESTESSPAQAAQAARSPLGGWRLPWQRPTWNTRQ